MSTSLEDTRYAQRVDRERSWALQDPQNCGMTSEEEQRLEDDVKLAASCLMDNITRNELRTLFSEASDSRLEHLRGFITHKDYTGIGVCLYQILLSEVEEYAEKRQALGFRFDQLTEGL